MSTRISSTLVGEEAMRVAEQFELQCGRYPRRVHTLGVGYDLQSSLHDLSQERFIEVKGFTEAWETHTWQPLYKSQERVLRENPDKFFLYIVHFAKAEFPSNPQMFVLSGLQILNDGFKLEPETFRLTPISRKRLEPYTVDVNKSVVKSQSKDLQHK